MATTTLATMVVVFVLYIILDTEARLSWLVTRASFRIRPTNPFLTEELDTVVDITEWGEMGRRVRKLSQWAHILTKQPWADKNAFQATLLSHFPFLSDTEVSIYAPWPASSNTNLLSLTGIVTCVGSNNFRMAAHLVTTLRRVHNSEMPIEVAYAGDEDLNPDKRSFLQTLDPNLSFIDLLDVFPSARRDLVKSGWAMKPFALLASSHQRAILVDADSIFLKNPDLIFEESIGLNRTGTLFFHDRAAGGGDGKRRLWLKQQIISAGLRPSHHLVRQSLFYRGMAWYEADSGVVALDKSRPAILLALIFATWMNTKSVRDEVTYQHFHGDKETFWVAMELSHVEYFFQPWYAGTLGTISNDEGQGQSDSDLAVQKVEICGTHMLHLDHTGETLLWINGGIYEHKGTPGKGLANMTHYWVGETYNIRLTQPEHQWYWHPGNVPCLRETGVKKVPDDLMGVIERMKLEAKEVDAMDVI